MPSVLVCRFTFDFPARVGLVENVAWLRINVNYMYIVTPEPSEVVLKRLTFLLYHGNHYVFEVTEIGNAFN